MVFGCLGFYIEHPFYCTILETIKVSSNKCDKMAVELKCRAKHKEVFTIIKMHHKWKKRML